MLEQLSGKLGREKRENLRIPKKIVVHWSTPDSLNNSKTSNFDMKWFTNQKYGFDQIFQILKGKEPFTNVGLT